MGNHDGQGGPPKFPKEVEFLGKVALTVAGSSAIVYGIKEKLGAPLPPHVEMKVEYNE